MKWLICLALLLLMTSVSEAGEIFGTIVDAGKPVPEGTKIEVNIAGKSFAGATEKSGAYHVFVAEKGKGTLTALYKNEKPTAGIFSFEKATRYDFTLDTVDGKLTLKRK